MIANQISMAAQPITPLTRADMEATFLPPAQGGEGDEMWQRNSLVQVHARHPLITMAPYIDWGTANQAGTDVATLPLIQWEFHVMAGMKLDPEYEHADQVKASLFTRAAVGPGAWPVLAWLCEAGITQKPLRTHAAYARHVHEFLRQKQGAVGHHMDLLVGYMHDLPEKGGDVEQHDWLEKVQYGHLFTEENGDGNAMTVVQLLTSVMGPRWTSDSRAEGTKFHLAAHSLLKRATDRFHNETAHDSVKMLETQLKVRPRDRNDDMTDLLMESLAVSVTQWLKASILPPKLRTYKFEFPGSSQTLELMGKYHSANPEIRAQVVEALMTEVLEEHSALDRLLKGAKSNRAWRVISLQILPCSLRSKEQTRKESWCK